MNNAVPDEATLFNQIVRFNWMPSSYINASWLSHWLTPCQLQMITHNSDACRTLNQFLLNEPFFDESEALEDVPMAAFSNPILQLLLQPLHTINHFIFYTGLAVNYQAIKQIICGQQQCKLTQQIGDDAYRFALHRAPFMAGPLCEILSLNLWQEREAKNSAIASGMALLAVATSGLPKMARKRLQYFFTKEQAAQLHPYWQEHQFSSDVSTKAQGLILKIAQESIDQWKTLSL